MRFINEDGGFTLSINLQKKVNYKRRASKIQQNSVQGFIVLSIREEICGKLWVGRRGFLTGV